MIRATPKTAVWILAFFCAIARADGESSMVEVKETPTQFIFIFGQHPWSAFGIDLGNKYFVVEKPGVKGFRPSLNAGRRIVYDAAQRTLTFEWEQTDGIHQLAWANVDRKEWTRLRKFVAAHLPNQILMEK
jgi:hypothetical protein